MKIYNYEYLDKLTGEEFESETPSYLELPKNDKEIKEITAYIENVLSNENKNFVLTKVF